MILASLSLLGLAAAGALSVPRVRNGALGTISIFYSQFAEIEPIHLALTAAFALGTLALCLVLKGRSLGDRDDSVVPSPLTATGVISAWTFGVILIGIIAVFHRYYLIDDEYSAWFQAQIFAAGKLQATVPPLWCRWIDALAPISITHTTSCVWHLSFLPIHSLLRAVFLRLQVDYLAGPVTGVLTVLLVGSIARRLWPDRPQRALVAMLVLACSTQFLFMSMTMYAMPTHLLVALIWLWTYLQDRVWSVALLPWVGFVALGVHSPTPHALWVAPFLLRFARQRRFAALTYLAAVYALSIMFWLGYLRAGGSVAQPVSVSVAAQTATSLFSMPSVLLQMVTSMHLSLVATWNTPIALICVVAATIRWQELDTFSRDAALSLIIMVLARAFMPTPQGGGWGYRWIYVGLGNFALLSAVGFEVLTRGLGARAGRKLLLASIATTVFVQTPLRVTQVARIVRPYYRTSRYLATLPAAVVVFPADRFMWGGDLIRNDPFLRRGPLLMNQADLSDADVSALRRLYPGRVRVVEPEEVALFGLERAPTFMGGALLVK